jgi:hypothetical protein
MEAIVNPLKAIWSFITLTWLTGSQAEAEREQEGPQGVAYDEALKRSGEAYYKKHGTYEGWEFDDTTMTGSE